MNSSGQTKISLMGALILPGLVAVAWLTAALASNYPLSESMGLVTLQSVLAYFTFYVLVRAFPRQQRGDGPRLIFIVGLHVLIYYGFSNVIPALLLELRPEAIASITNRIPVSSVWAYSRATGAAMLLLLGLVLGCRFASRLWPLPCHHWSRTASPYAWLPPYNLAMLACVMLLVLVMVGTILYGETFDAAMLAGEAMAGLPFSQQLLYHGLFYFLPIAPVLATAALIQAANPRKRQLARWLLVIASIATFSALLTWGMRSTAMLSIALPLGLLVFAGKVNWRKILLPAMGLVVIVYGAVTFVRNSDFQALLARTSDLTQLTMRDIASALITRSTEQNVMQRVLVDASYRTAGLEAAASLIQAQTEARFPLQWGKTIRAGFMQALPVSLRPTFQIPERIKTSPAYLGLFQEGDWVTTILAEFVLDFGSYFLFFPAVLAGLGLALIDRALLGLGRRPALEGLLILRIAFLLFILSNGGSLADMTLMFFKATIGYTALFLVLGGVARIYLSPKRQVNC